VCARDEEVYRVVTDALVLGNTSVCARDEEVYRVVTKPLYSNFITLLSTHYCRGAVITTVLQVDTSEWVLVAWEAIRALRWVVKQLPVQMQITNLEVEGFSMKTAIIKREVNMHT
jgi:hypothetical protein